MSLLDVIGITAIMPFMAIVSNPIIIEKNKLLHFTYINLGYKSQHDFLVFVGYFVFTLINKRRWWKIQFVIFKLGRL